jgi:predicted transcriptional regulator
MQDIVQDYKKIVSNMDLMIKNSGYKSSFIADSLKLSQSAFYAKRKNNNFIVEEVGKTVELLSVFEEQQTVAMLTKMLETENVNYNEKDLFDIIYLTENE